MRVVRDNLQNGKAVTWGTDDTRLRKLASTGEQYRISTDLGAGFAYCHIKADWRQSNPYDVEAREALQAEFEQLKDAWLAGCNA